MEDANFSDRMNTVGGLLTDQKRRRNKIDACAFCGKMRQLCMSHAIPDAIFRDLFKQGSGQAFRSTTGEKAGRSQESGKCLLMCAECESDFNCRFDKPGYHLLKELRNSVDCGVRTLTVHHWKLIEFLLSVFWRATVSSANKYRGFVLPTSKTSLLKSVLRSRKASAMKRIVIRVRNIVDETGYIGPGMLPADACTIWENEPSTKNVWLALLIMGFYVELEMPGPKQRDHSLGYLVADRRQLSLVDVGMRADPKLHQAFRFMLDQHYDGDVVQGLYGAMIKHHKPLATATEHESEVVEFGQAMAAAERAGLPPSEVLRHWFDDRS